MYLYYTLHTENLGNDQQLDIAVGVYIYIYIVTPIARSK